MVCRDVWLGHRNNCLQGHLLFGRWRCEGRCPTSSVRCSVWLNPLNAHSGLAKENKKGVTHFTILMMTALTINDCCSKRNDFQVRSHFYKKRLQQETIGMKKFNFIPFITECSTAVQCDGKADGTDLQKPDHDHEYRGNYTHKNHAVIKMSWFIQRGRLVSEVIILLRYRESAPILKTVSFAGDGSVAYMCRSRKKRDLPLMFLHKQWSIL